MTYHQIKKACDKERTPEGRGRFLTNIDPAERLAWRMTVAFYELLGPDIADTETLSVFFDKTKSIALAAL
jgi:hypothetical protein